MKWDMKRHGYVRLEEMTDGPRRFLRLTPSPQFVKDMKAKRRDEGDDALSGEDLLWSSLSDHLQSGWERVEPCEISALTDAPIVSNNIRRDDSDKIIGGTYVYAYMSYQVRSCVRDLLDYGFASWEYAELEFTPDQRAVCVFYEFMLDEQGGKIAMNYANDLLRRLKDAGLQIVAQTD